ALEQRRHHVQRRHRDNQPHHRSCKKVGRVELRRLLRLELAIEQQHDADQDDRGRKGDQRQRVVGIAEQRGAVAGIAGRMCSSTWRVEKAKPATAASKERAYWLGRGPQRTFMMGPIASTANWMRCSRHSGQGSSCSTSWAAKATA